MRCSRLRRRRRSSMCTVVADHRTVVGFSIMCCGGMDRKRLASHIVQRPRLLRVVTIAVVAAISIAICVVVVVVIEMRRTAFEAFLRVMVAAACGFCKAFCIVVVIGFLLLNGRQTVAAFVAQIFAGFVMVATAASNGGPLIAWTAGLFSVSECPSTAVNNERWQIG